MKLRKTSVGLLVVILVAGVFRLWQIDAIPPGFHFDESFEGLEAWRILTDPSYRPVFLTGNFGVTPLNAYANALTFGIFTFFGGEVGPVAMRITAAIFGVLGVAATWAAARELRLLDPDRLTASFPFFAAALLATLRWHVHFSRMGIEPVLVPLETAAALWLLLLGRRTGSWLAFAGCGLVLALGMYSYQGAWVLPLVIAAAWSILWWTDRDSAVGQNASRARRYLVGGLLIVATSAVLVAPLAITFYQQPDLMLLRPAQIATSSTEAATHQGIVESAIAYGMMFAPLAQQGDLDPRRNVPGLAALNLWQAIPFWLGIGLSIWRIRRPAYSILLIALVVMLLPGVLSEYAPHYHRVLGAAAPVALLGGVGLDGIWRWGRPARVARNVERKPSRMWRWAWAGWLSVALLVAGAVVSARDYFVRWATLPDLFYAFDVGLWTIGQEIAAQPAGAAIYLTPRSAEHPTLAFAWSTQPDSHGPPVTFDGRHIFPLTAGNNAQPEHYWVLEDEDFRTRLLLPELFPNATVEQELLDRQGRVYARNYLRPASTPPRRLPGVAAQFEIGDGIALAGYDAQVAEVDAGKMLYVQLYWDVTQAPTQDWTVFVHLLDRTAVEGAQRVAGADSHPGAGSLPASRWQPGWRILDEYQILLPENLAPGDYALAIGLYTAQGDRLPENGAELPIGEVSLE